MVPRLREEDGVGGWKADIRTGRAGLTPGYAKAAINVKDGIEVCRKANILNRPLPASAPEYAP